MKQLRSVLFVLVVVVLLAACPGKDVKRDLSDSTAPTMSFTVTASKNVAGGLETVQFGSPVEVTGSGGSLLVKAEDDNGVRWVELWLTEKKTCGGVMTGPSLAGAPAKRTEGTVTDTDAPSSLSAAYDINAQQLQHGCVYEWDVWGKASNAATTPVEATSAHSAVTLRT